MKYTLACIWCYYYDDGLEYNIKPDYWRDQAPQVGLLGKEGGAVAPTAPPLPTPLVYEYASMFGL